MSKSISPKKLPPPNYKSRVESKEDREIRILESFYMKKLSKDYVDRLTVLLYNSKNKNNYSQKRNNIKKTIYKFDDNNLLYLTLPKLKKFKNKDAKPVTNNISNINTKTETTEYTNTNKISSKPSPKKQNENSEEILDENIKEILYDNETMDKKDKKKGKILFEQLKTKYNLFDYEINNNNNNNSNYIYDNNNFKQKLKNLPKISKKKQIPAEYKLIATPQQISEFDYLLGRSFINGNLRYLTKKQRENLAYIAELDYFNSVDKLKEKSNIIKEMKYGNQSKKKLLMPIDIFKYDKKKWEKIYNEQNNNNNHVVIADLNEKNKEKLDNMNEKINKLNIDAFVADKEVNKVINNINYFLNRYGVDNNSSRQSYSSNKSIKHQNSKKREKRMSEERKE
jgi:hypothetical protein